MSSSTSMGTRLLEKYAGLPQALRNAADSVARKSVRAVLGKKATKEQASELIGAAYGAPGVTDKYRKIVKNDKLKDKATEAATKGLSKEFPRGAATLKRGGKKRDITRRDKATIGYVTDKVENKLFGQHAGSRFARSGAIHPSIEGNWEIRDQLRYANARARGDKPIVINLPDGADREALLEEARTAADRVSARKNLNKFLRRSERIEAKGAKKESKRLAEFVAEKRKERLDALAQRREDYYNQVK